MTRPHGVCAAIYARTNHDQRDLSEWRRRSIHIEYCLSAAKSHGYSDTEILIYKDEGLSGIAKSAPSLEKLLEGIGNLESIYVPSLSRISRNHERLSAD